MPVLSNPRHERFANELAKGKSATEAYELAGYKPDDGHAARLAGNGRVKERLTELQEGAAKLTEITLASITTDLDRIAGKAEALSDAPGLSVARNAKMDVAKLKGWLKDKVEHTGANGGPIETKDVSARETIERRIASLSARAPAEGHTGKPH